MQIVYRVNSGPIPTDSWLHRPEEGGGMLVGEMCHFIDLMQFLTGEQPAEVICRSLKLDRDDLADHDNLSLTVVFEGGSVGTLIYNTVGDKAAPKERLEVFGGGTAAFLDDFRHLEIFSGGRRTRRRSRRQDKGHREEVEQTIRAFREHGQGPIPIEGNVAGMRVVFAAQESLRSAAPVAFRPASSEIPSE